MRYYLELHRKILEFVSWISPTLDKFPNTEKYRLTARIENEIFSMIDSINAFEHSRTVSHLYTLDKNISNLRDLFIIASLHKNISCINNKKYNAIIFRLSEIGKMTGSLIRTIKISKNKLPDNFKDIIIEVQNIYANNYCWPYVSTDRFIDSNNNGFIRNPITFASKKYRDPETCTYDKFSYARNPIKFYKIEATEIK